GAARPEPGARSGQRGTRPDSGGKPDSVAVLVRWIPLDSVGEALLKREGYQSVRYQADLVGFAAQERIMSLVGKKGARAAVLRAPSLLVADTIQYSDTTANIDARGDTITLRDPQRGEDLVAHDTLHYDVAARRGTAKNVVTAATSGERWILSAHRAGFSGDTAAGGGAFYGRDGWITSCADSLPHYHFVAGELKYVNKSLLVARPATLYIQGVPVARLPFIFQDIRSGRRSGILTPRFGFAELVRNSPTYRRNVENLGYYFALNEYLDAAVSLDWRSAANATEQDPGWSRYNATMRYRWRDRFLSGQLSASQNTLSSGSTNTSLSLSHQQDFSLRSKLTANLNYVTNTTVQRQTTLNPFQSIATIASQLNYQREMGPLSLSLGGTRRQYPGRRQVDQDFPSLNVTSKPLRWKEWLTWTPGLQFASSSSKHLDSRGEFSSFFTNRNGVLDSLTVDRSTRNTTASITSPLKIGDFQLPLSLRFADRLNDFPESRILIDPTDTTKRTTRIYRRTFVSTIDIETSINLPQFLQGSWNVSPTVSMGNVDPSGFFVRSERTGGKWVAQRKRFSYGLSSAPSFFALIPGIGPVQRFRHAITPTLSYAYSPEATVSTEFLQALGKSPQGYLGSFAQNRFTLGLATAIEAKLAPSARDTSGRDEGRKIRLLSMQFSPMTWDFERARRTKRSGFATDRFNLTARSDLLPGLDLGADWSLYQGSLLSDTAKFSPYRETVRATLSLNAQSALVRAIGRLLGADASGGTRDTAGIGSQSIGAPGSRLGGTQQIAGQTMRNPAFANLPAGRGFDLNLTYSGQRQRPPVGGSVVEFDATAQCEPYRINPIQYQFCVQSALATPPVDNSFATTTSGGAFYRVPAQSSVQTRTSFNLTRMWSASWSTSYDFERREFAAHIVTLQRDLHDWRAVFAFTQAPNGNFAFSFFVALKAEPDLKFNYDRTAIRQPGSAGVPLSVP
ncbi:MAG: hypothetical protein K2X99_08530, partial [Gemmatimonadaceae bacterium]|nr:hypothetical protein [Gemmatimonadaceae bacterium]